MTWSECGCKVIATGGYSATIGGGGTIKHLNVDHKKHSYLLLLIIYHTTEAGHMSADEKKDSDFNHKETIQLSRLTGLT